MSAQIQAICTSQNIGERKTPIESVGLRPNHGIVSDVHAGDCVMPRERVFVKVLGDAKNQIGETIEIIKATVGSCFLFQ